MLGVTWGPIYERGDQFITYALGMRKAYLVDDLDAVAHRELVDDLLSDSIEIDTPRLVAGAISTRLGQVDFVVVVVLMLQQKLCPLVSFTLSTSVYSSLSIRLFVSVFFSFLLVSLLIFSL